MTTINGITYKLKNNKVFRWDDLEDDWILTGLKQIPKEHIEPVRKKSSSSYIAKRGSDLPRAKLTESDIRQMRADYTMSRNMINELNAQYSLDALAKNYGVNHSTIEKAIYGRTWRHVK